MKSYTTVQGDTWDSIAYWQYGDRDFTGKIMQMNPEYYEYFIFPAGIVLKMPENTPSVNSLLPPWKRGVG